MPGRLLLLREQLHGFGRVPRVLASLGIPNAKNVMEGGWKSVQYLTCCTG